MVFKKASLVDYIGLNLDLLTKPNCSSVTCIQLGFVKRSRFNPIKSTRLAFLKTIFLFQSS